MSYANAKKAVLHALELDETLAEAHAKLGGILTWGEWKWEETRKELIIAIESLMDLKSIDTLQVGMNFGIQA